MKPISEVAVLVGIKSGLDAIVPHDDRHPTARPKEVARINELTELAYKIARDAEQKYGKENCGAVYDVIREIIKIAPPRHS